jgi:hypothetical protein
MGITNFDVIGTKVRGDHHCENKWEILLVGAKHHFVAEPN